MNIFEKMQKARVTLQEKDVKKSGKNKFAGYDFFELSDILPHINIIMNDLKMCSFISYNNDFSTLTIVNSEKPEEQIVFTSPMANASLKGCHDIQNLGAVESYQRRYLYMTAFEIVECDLLDNTTGKDETDIKTPKKNLSDAQIKRLFALGNKAGKNPKGILEAAKVRYKVADLKDMTKDQYDEICSTLEGMTV